MIGTSTGEVYEDGLDHILSSSQSRLEDSFSQFSPGQQTNFETKLTPEEETSFQGWKQKMAPNDSGFDYDLRGAYKAGVSPDPESNHWPDTFKKPNHETFSNESMYAKDRPDLAGSWSGPNHDVYTPPGQKPIITAPEPNYSGLVEGSKAAEWAAYLGTRGTALAPTVGAVTWANTGLGVLTAIHDYVKTNTVDYVKKKVAEGTPIDKVQFEKGSLGDMFGILSHLEEKFGKPPSDKPQKAAEGLTGPEALVDIFKKFKDSGGKIDEKAFKEAVERMPESTNIEDRRMEPLDLSSPNRSEWGKSGPR